MYKKGRMSGAVREQAVADEVMMDAAPVMYAESNVALNSMASKKEAQVDLDGAVEEAPATATAGGGASEKSEEKPRPVEMPLAFFMPSLTSGDDGNVTVEFETPNFNTTWQFQIVGYTEDLLTTSLIKDAVASKQVMVQSNVPRFVRTGDKAQVSALLFNNSDKTLPLHGEIRIFNPYTGETISSKHIGAEATAPSANRKMTVDFTVPDNVDAVGIAAFAYAEGYSDGEQTAVPVLPSSTPVVESDNFYLGVGDRSASVKLPKYSKGANVTFRYCSNPVWECVMALPSISTPESKNLLSLMRALYANSVALDVSGKYPDVRKGLESALKSKDSLKSNLEKDAALKTVKLNNTPWVNNAESETARMRSLSTLLDIEKGRETVAGILNDVKALQNTDGGWSWCPGMKSSLFITGQALLQFGMMRHIGCMPAQADEMVAKAIAYCDREVYDNYVRSKRIFSTTYMVNYLYIRSFFNAGSGPKGFSELKGKALRAISEEWTGFGIYDKATAASLLWREKGYEKEAKVILESLEQFASKSDDKGWWFDNLDSGFSGWSRLITTAQVLEAYSDITPEAPAVDGLRQWLVLQKETEDWGSNSYTVEVVQAILSSGSKWTSEASLPEVKIGGRSIQLPSAVGLAGLLTVGLDAKELSGKTLTVEKTGAAPSWGGVVSQYVAPIKEVKSAECENLKIEKMVLLVDQTPAGESLSKAKRFKVGDKVRVTLTITCDKDMDYVAVIDERGSCMEPIAQTSGYYVEDGLWMYREVRDTKTSFFISHLAKGVNVITYDCHLDRAGEYAVGIATAQSQYSPLQTAHTGGRILTISE